MAPAEHLPSIENLPYVEELYVRFLRDRSSVDAGWASFFASLDGSSRFARHPVLGPSPDRGTVFNSCPRGSPPGGCRAAEMTTLQDRVDQLVRAFRIRGHLEAQLDPLGRERRRCEELTWEFYGFTEDQLDLPFSSATIHDTGTLTLREILDRLRDTYCRSIGVQFQHIEELEIKRFLERRMESTRNRISLSRPLQLRILRWLSEATHFEEFVQKKYQGAKSFSLEGAESLLPLLGLAFRKAGEQSMDVMVIGMAHRGRLNVLANIVGKREELIFQEFEDLAGELQLGRGDVKYHLGYHADRETESGHVVHLSLCFNPSHLEYVGPVALGRVRALQDRYGDPERRNRMALLIHGDASFAGEGVVQETLNLSRLPGYATGGTLHVIVNNQIGFTTTPEQSRSSTYATEVARLLQVPIFHVNGEDPEAVAQVTDLAMDFRARYRRDVVIDMYCYRRRGHNEGDEPSFTQPLMYEHIRQRPPVRETYLEQLLDLGEITRAEAEEIVAGHRERLEAELASARSESAQRQLRERIIAQDLATAGAAVTGPGAKTGVWSGYRGGPERPEDEVETAVPADRLRALIERQLRLPEDFHLHPKLGRRMRTWARMAAGEAHLDWAAAENLAMATLATEGYRVRLSGQDSERGTFSHRHAVLHDIENGHTYTPLQHLEPDQAAVEVVNSPLSEAGVLGFEYGYSLDYPDALVMWEAQFGDFVNCAQVIIDQFLASAEDKWRRLSGLVLLLPHGFEGQGPEHSSARLERFLMLAAEDNLQIVNLTTPAQLFHCLRRQTRSCWRKPLIVMSPKSLLRHPLATSPLEDLASGGFQKVLPDARPEPRSTSRVLLCSGKLYYELVEYREAHDRADCAILRLEQLFPLRAEELALALEPYPEGIPVLWVQEEPRNMGAWTHLHVHHGDWLRERFDLRVCSRHPSASPATGSLASHRLEQEQLIQDAFGDR